MSTILLKDIKRNISDFVIQRGKEKDNLPMAFASLNGTGYSLFGQQQEEYQNMGDVHNIKL